MQRGQRMSLFRSLRQLLLADHPFNLPFVEALTERKYAGLRKFRVGEYRVLFTLDLQPVHHQKFDYQGTLVVIMIEHRKDIYRP
jgi:mRNA-degrading endonuclease RelE of RelBE toxin-antitoxin system